MRTRTILPLRLTCIALWLLAVSGCASGQVRSSLYSATGETWRFTVSETEVRFDETLGSSHWAWGGSASPATATEDALVLEGELERTYVIAGLAEEDRVTYSALLKNELCENDEGEIMPTSIRLSIGERTLQGCGSSLTPLTSSDQ